MPRAFMRFEVMFDVWYVTVLRDGRTVRELKLGDASRVEEMARRGGGLRTLADKQAMESALRAGRGGCDLMLTDEQWRKLTG